MAARLTRQEMKRDEIRETLTRFFAYITEHTRGMVLLIVGVLALVLVGVGVFAYFESRLERGNELLAQALAAFEGDVVAENADPENALNPTFASEEARSLRAEELFERVESDFGGTSVGRIATVYLGKLAAARGDLGAARERWQEFLDSESDNHMLATEVRVNLLATDRAVGRGEEVVSRLREELGAGEPQLPTEIVLDQLATTLDDLGRSEEARQYYQRIVDEFPASPYSARAQQRLSGL